MRTLYLVSKRLPRVCMDGSNRLLLQLLISESAPRVHGWFLLVQVLILQRLVCPACAWMVPRFRYLSVPVRRLPRVCMDGSLRGDL